MAFSYTTFRKQSVSAKSIAIEITLTHRRTEASATYYFSTDGFVTGTADTPANTYYQDRVLQGLDIAEVLFGNGNVGGKSKTSFGDIVLDNSDGGLDELEDYSSDGASIVVKAGEIGGDIDEYQTVATLVGERHTVNEREVRFSIADKQFLLERAISMNVYGGRESALWFDNDPATNRQRVQATITDVGILAAVNNVDNFTVEAWCYAVPLTSSSFQIFATGGTGLSGRGFANLNLGINGSDQIISFSAISNYVLSSGSLETKTWNVTTLDSGDSILSLSLQNTSFHISFSNNGDTGVFIINGTNVATDSSPATSTPGAVDNSFLRIGEITNAITGTGFNGMIDDVRVYTDSLSAEERMSRWYRPLTTKEAEETFVYYKLDDASGTTAADSGPNGLDGTLNGSSGLPVWVSALDGDSALTGKSKPLTYGSVTNAPGAFVGTLDEIYQFHDGTVSAFTTVYDGGNALTKAASQPSTFFAFIDNATPPSAGEWWEWLPLGLVRLGSTPTYQLTADLDGDVDIDDTFNNKLSSIIEEIALTKAGFTAGEVDSAGSFELYDDEPTTGNIGVHVPLGANDYTIADTFDALCSSISAYWYFDATGTLKIGILSLPLDKTVLDLTVDDHTTSFQRLESQLPAWKLSVPYAKNYTIQRGGDISGITASERSALAQKLALPFQTYEIQDVSIKDVHTSAETFGAQGEGCIQSGTFAAVEARRRFKFYARTRKMYRVTVPGLLATEVELGDTVGLTHDRFDLDGGALDSSNFLFPHDTFLVIEKNTRFSARDYAVELLLWSPEKRFRYTSDGRKRVPKGTASVRKGGILVA